MSNPNVALFARASETIEVNGVKLVVRQVRRASDLMDLRDQEDGNYRLLIRCVFDEAGNPLFSEADIPALKDEASEVNFIPVLNAIARVNGLDIEDRAKNSDAAPSGG